MDVASLRLPLYGTTMTGGVQCDPPVDPTRPGVDAGRSLIVDSADGVEWRATELSDLVDAETAKNMIAASVWVDDRGLIVNVVLSNGTPGVVAKTITFVGRPSGDSDGGAVSSRPRLERRRRSLAGDSDRANRAAR
jgi:hypothetical protein